MSMFKKRARPQTVVRAISREADDKEKEVGEDGQALEGEREEGEPSLPIADLIEWRKLRRGRKGIDVAKLNIGDGRSGGKKKKRAREEDQGGLKKGHVEDDEHDEEAKEAKTRRVVRASNFTQQTNTLDVDKHMMAYIEENLKARNQGKSGSNGESDDDDENKKELDPQDEVFRAASGRWKIGPLGGTSGKEGKRQEEGSVTSSMGMLTAIPEVDLGMDTRLKNIEETEKAKRIVAQERNDRSTFKHNSTNNDEDHLVANRFYRPNLRAKSDADILRDAKLEAMGLNPQDHDHTPQYHHSSNHDRPQMATDEMVMERFKKRMRK
ncbi:hepatocellular carcinoma-associated antigen 59-domain-containing protein [Ephemerocybe angulata]|uniref:Hepatocellular carcinoma-associated antigen 59-domain-containing protein n=1 Tax=Ephemerocybe angulata TaxID=980116 RepID=A0A8H6ID46_9AGAR|nr:hepatocellular carcinoma-associated antigen 59-domain-containing protein [Tulosesus angulatus]